MGKSWNSFWMGTVAAVIIAIIAGVVLQNVGMSSADKFATSSTRQ